jgi:hypothetical protein
MTDVTCARILQRAAGSAVPPGPRSLLGGWGAVQELVGPPLLHVPLAGMIEPPGQVPSP